MKRGFAVLACLCALSACAYFAVSRWGIRHETLNLYDNARQRSVPVDLAVRWDYEMKANDGFWKLPVAIISNGNTVKNTEYSFLANVFAARGYLVASIQQDVPTDPPLVTKTGLPYVGRLAVYQKGEANILFVLEALRKLKPNADYAHLTLAGHSNGGDMAMYFALQHPGQVSKVVTLDNLRVPFVLRDKLKILSFRSKDPHFMTDPGVLPESRASQGGWHQHHQDPVPAHLDERPRPRNRKGAHSGNLGQVFGGKQGHRTGVGRKQQSEVRQCRGGFALEP